MIVTFQFHYFNNRKNSVFTKGEYDKNFEYINVKYKVIKFNTNKTEDSIKDLKSNKHNNNIYYYQEVYIEYLIYFIKIKN